MFIVGVKSVTLLRKELSYSRWVKYMKLIIRKTIIRTIETFFFYLEYSFIDSRCGRLQSCGRSPCLPYASRHLFSKIFFSLLIWKVVKLKSKEPEGLHLRYQATCPNQTLIHSNVLCFKMCRSVGYRMTTCFENLLKELGIRGFQQENQNIQLNWSIILWMK